MRDPYSKRFSAKELHVPRASRCGNGELNSAIRGVLEYAVFIANFASGNFFFFLVRRYWVHFASAACCKSLAGLGFVSAGEAKRTEFRLGGGTLVRRKV